MRRAAAVATAGAGGVAAVTAYYHRPSADLSDGMWLKTRVQHVEADEFPRPSSQIRAARPAMGDLDAVAKLNPVMAATTAFVCSTVAVVARIWMTGFNTTEINRGDADFDRFVEAVSNRATGQPLITLANHSSVIDDPVLMAAMLPWESLLQPRNFRFAACSQEVCFRNDIAAAFMACGQVLPIKRGAGIDHPFFLDLCRHAAAGRWVHLFPEGKVNQTGKLGSDGWGVRSVAESERVGGKLKWGVGKMIAHAPVTPMVIAFSASGLAEMLPCDEPMGKMSPIKLRNIHGKLVRIRVGGALRFDDLIDAHVKLHGPLWKYGARPADDNGDWRTQWPSSPSERVLYSAITRRVEGALAELESKVVSAGGGGPINGGVGRVR